MSFNEWKKYRIGDILDVKHGFAFKGEFFSSIPTENILLTPGNFHIGGGFKDEKFKYYLGVVPDEYVLSEGDIIVTMTDLSKDGDTIGYPAKVPFKQGSNFLHNQRLGLLIFKSTDVSKDFIYWALRTNQYHLFIANSVTGTTVKHTSPSRIKEYEFYAPEIIIQNKIATSLNSIDEKIENNLATNLTLEEIARTLFKEWFVNFNYPNADRNLKLTEFGEIPESWKVGALGDIYKTTSGGTPSRTKPKYYENGSIGWVKSKELNNSFIIDTEEKITPDALKNSSAKLLPKHSVLIAIAGATIGEVGIIAHEFACNQNACVFLPNGNYPFTFIYHFLRQSKDDIVGRSVGSAQPYISQQTLLQYRLVIPPSQLVQEYHRIVFPLFQKIQDNIEENDSLKALRDSLLPKLISGEIIVNPSITQ